MTTSVNNVEIQVPTEFGGMKARDYQLAGVNETVAHLEQIKRDPSVCPRVLVVQPTGTGKTQVAAMLLSDPRVVEALRKRRELLGKDATKPVRVLVMAHRTTLLDMMQEKLTSDVGFKPKIVVNYNSGL